MQIELPLETMSLADKLAVMETLWADISKQPDELPSPGWHNEVLEQRRRLVAEGKLNFLNWDKSLAELRKELHGNSAP